MNNFIRKAWLAVFCVAGTIPAAFASEDLVEANQLYAKKDYEGAVAAFRGIIAKEQDPQTKAEAKFSLGLTLKQLHQYQEAIKVFGELVEQPVNDQGPGSRLREHSYRPRAQWEIGNCLFEQGQYQEALQAYRDTKEKHRFQFFCGNARASHEHRYAYQVGLCHEHLGEINAAVECYLEAVRVDASGLTFNPRPHLRLVEIYAEAGQLDRLIALLDNMDEKSMMRRRASAAKSGIAVSEEFLKSFGPTRVIRQELKLRSLAEQGRRDELIKLLATRRGVGPPSDAEDWIAIRASQLLAQTPEESTADLLKSLKEKSTNERWAAFALALCGIDEGVAWIRERARTEENSWAARSFIYSLTLAGEKGKAAIAELETNAEGNLKWAISAYHDDNLRAEIEIPKFPDVKVSGDLPDSVKP